MEPDVSLCLDASASLADRALELMPYPVVILDRQLRVRFANHRARERLEPSPPEEDPNPPFDAVLGRSGRIPTEARLRIMSCCGVVVNGRSGHGKHDALIAVAPGHTIALYARELGDERWMIVLEDRQGRTDPAATLDDTHRDPLTELGNRRHLEKKLFEALADDDPDSHPAILVLDIDRFQELNQRLGRQGGDALLRAVSGRLRRAKEMAGSGDGPPPSQTRRGRRAASGAAPGAGAGSGERRCLSATAGGAPRRAACPTSAMRAGSSPAPHPRLLPGRG